MLRFSILQIVFKFISCKVIIFVKLSSDVAFFINSTDRRFMMCGLHIAQNALLSFLQKQILSMGIFIINIINYVLRKVF